jgi:hypothetical protein
LRGRPNFRVAPLRSRFFEYDRTAEQKPVIVFPTREVPHKREQVNRKSLLL